MVKDYYKIMGITDEATVGEVKKAYRRLAMKYHPDRNRNDPACEQHLKEINEAYQVLGDSEKRRHYDLLYQGAYREPLTDDRQNVSDDFPAGRWTFNGRSFGALRRGSCKRRGFGMRGCGMRRWQAK